MPTAPLTLTTFNVNGVRAALQKGLTEYLESESADIICLQETKAQPDQVDLSWLKNYHAMWNSAEKRGYSGTLVLSRLSVLNVQLGMGIPEHDNEGRVITVEYPAFYLVNVYTPNAQADLKRLSYRMKWDAVFRNHLKHLGEKKPVLVCGDLNCAHQEIDLANPKTNRKNPGFSDDERASFTAHLDSGFVDVLRVFEPDTPGLYTWWTQRMGPTAREKNIGWRLDYWLASAALQPQLRSCKIRTDVYGSDHCPVELVADMG